MANPYLYIDYYKINGVSYTDADVTVVTMDDIDYIDLEIGYMSGIADGVRNHPRVLPTVVSFAPRNINTATGPEEANWGGHVALNQHSFDLSGYPAIGPIYSVWNGRIYGWMLGELTDIAYTIYCSGVVITQAEEYLGHRGGGITMTVNYVDPFNPLHYTKSLLQGQWGVVALPAIDEPNIIPITDYGNEERMARYDFADRGDLILLTEVGPRRRDYRGHGDYKNIYYKVQMEIATAKKDHSSPDYGGVNRADILLQKCKRIIESNLQWLGEEEVSYIKPMDDGRNVSTKSHWKYTYTIEIKRRYKRAEVLGP